MESACPEEYVPSSLSVERVRHFVRINMLVFSAVSSWLCRAVWLCLIGCMCLAALYSVDVPLSGICRGSCRASKRHSVERHVSRVSTHFRDQSRAWHRIYRIVPHIVLVSFRAGQHRQRQVHIHTRFTFTHASHSHTLHTHTRFTLTHALHSHTRQPFRIVPRVVLVNFRAGQHRSVKFTFTHALVKGLRRCTSYLL
jgi:hypothetical protein